MKIYSRNIAIGCPNQCSYCFSRYNALEKGLIANHEEWATEQILPDKLNEEQRRSPGVLYQFPTNHDITPALLQPSITYIGNLLRAGNKVRVCTKPRLECIRAICDEFGDYKKQLSFDMTITSLDEHRSRMFEPGAPLPEERLAALRYASQQGFTCSVTIEPMLEGEIGTQLLVESVLPHVGGNITLGIMVQANRRLVIDANLRAGVMLLLDHIREKDALVRLRNAFWRITHPTQEPVVGLTIPTVEIIDPEEANRRREIKKLFC